MINQNNRIKKLPEILINQIAAGEVIERPASVLKELLENSIDANSTMIRIYLEEGGINNIKVIDNGAGIHPEDLPLVFLQHATSKINNIDDLIDLHSLGFRGEALASIASVAKVNINSSQKEPSGTVVEVKDLFYNVPARRKFLRSSKTEFNYTQEMFKRIALSNFSIGFLLYHNNKLIKNLPAIPNNDPLYKEKRIVKLYGKNFIENAINFNCTHYGLELSGWITNGYNIASCNIRSLYINNRVVKDRLLQIAIKQATQKFSETLAYCLYLNLDPKLVDVNVHPTKQEVRFSNPKLVHAFVYESLLEALNNTSSIKKEQKLPLAVTNKVLLTDPQLLNYSCDNLSFCNQANFEQQKFFLSEKENVKIFPFFNNRYLIIEQDLVNNYELKLIETFSALKWLIKIRLKNFSLLDKFFLIIPERVVLSDSVINKFDNLDQFIKLLEKFKFIVDQIHHNVLLIKAIPDCLYRLHVNLDYKGWLTELLQSNIKPFAEINELDFINLILRYISAESLNLYTKNDLISLFNELTKEEFEFSSLKEQEFASLLI